ncbi:YtcA family lipoprotein [Methylobacterium soli]|uniref:Uncharacterized protein n=1 Tax=Methylobacterium soli TaxID=553447 RepID=A0A6L3T663_9HYPH|nr:YtcA family lipoprotein [Methylobacterium soli]KAB1080871.1 hypothetical protein F6X53_04045 [Methylobacterium soli]GJE45682.1 hypothetical protein AEGHOMDF_4882 [Methylobacterium soli]
MRRSGLVERSLLVPLLFSALSGCSDRGAPSFTLVGAFFPAWMLFALIGIAVAIGARAIFVASGLAVVLPNQLFVCAAIGVGFALLAWLLWFAA